MFRKKLLAMGLIITIALCGLSGCTSNTTTVPQETTTPEVTSGQEETSTEKEETTTEEPTSEEETVGGVMGYVDAEDICKHISINGKVVEFPWTLNELGEEYTFGEIQSVDLESKIGSAYILYNGSEIALVEAIVDTELDRNSLIYSLMPYNLKEIILYDIYGDVNEGDIIKRFGIPTSTMEGDYHNNYTYITDEVYIDFMFNAQTDKFSSWNISLKKEFINKIQEGEN